MLTINSTHPFKMHIHTELERIVGTQGQTDHKAFSTHSEHRTSFTMITAVDATRTRDLISNILNHSQQTASHRSSLYLHSSPPCPWLPFKLDSGQQQQMQSVLSSGIVWLVSFTLGKHNQRVRRKTREMERETTKGADFSLGS